MQTSLASYLPNATPFSVIRRCVIAISCCSCICCHREAISPFLPVGSASISASLSAATQRTETPAKERISCPSSRPGWRTISAIGLDIACCVENHIIIQRGSKRLSIKASEKSFSVARPNAYLPITSAYSGRMGYFFSSSAANALGSCCSKRAISAGRGFPVLTNIRALARRSWRESPIDFVSSSARLRIPSHCSCGFSLVESSGNHLPYGSNMSSGGPDRCARAFASAWTSRSNETNALELQSSLSNSALRSARCVTSAVKAVDSLMTAAENANRTCLVRAKWSNASFILLRGRLLSFGSVSTE